MSISEKVQLLPLVKNRECFPLLLQQHVAAHYQNNILPARERARTCDSRRRAKKEHQKRRICRRFWTANGYFLNKCGSLELEKENIPNNTIFYVNQGYRTTKLKNKYFVNELFVVAQLAPLSEQSSDVEKYECADDEVKMLRAMYDAKTTKFLGLQRCVAKIIVRDDNVNFFDYGYEDENYLSRLYSAHKQVLPLSFRARCFSFLKKMYERGELEHEPFSKLFFYMPATVDRCEYVNWHETSYWPQPKVLDIQEFGTGFSPSDCSKSRDSVLSVMKKVAENSSRNLLENTEKFLKFTKINNGDLLYPIKDF